MGKKDIIQRTGIGICTLLLTLAVAGVLQMGAVMPSMQQYLLLER